MSLLQPANDFLLLFRIYPAKNIRSIHCLKKCILLKARHIDASPVHPYTRCACDCSHGARMIPGEYLERNALLLEILQNLFRILA